MRKTSNMSAVFEKRDSREVIVKKAGQPLRILQLTDIHIGGSVSTRKKDKLALDAVRKIVRNAKPDFVVVTGDMVYPMPWLLQGSCNNLKASKMFASVMEDLGVEWTVVFGNHDSEVWAKCNKSALADFYASMPHCHFQRGEEKITGIGNYCIPVLNEDGTINVALMFVDSNAYLTWNFFSGFDTIHDDQIEWYKNTITDLSKGRDLVPSLAFFHIPPKEFKEGWEKCYLGSGEATYHCGFVQEKDNYFGYPKTVDGKFFPQMVEFGSCKGMFMGHDHLNTLSITYKGIRLTYGMSIDYNAYKGIEKRFTQRGGTIIEIGDDASFDVKMLPLTSCN